MCRRCKNNPNDPDWGIPPCDPPIDYNYVAFWGACVDNITEEECEEFGTSFCFAKYRICGVEVEGEWFVTKERVDTGLTDNGCPQNCTPVCTD